MKKRIFIVLSLMCLSCAVHAQTKPAATPSPTKPAATPQTKPAAAPQSDAQAVLAAFDKLTDGIEHANVNEVMSVYWNNPQLNLFNYNGTVTKGWEQVRKNRESSYPQIKDAKLEVRDKAVHMLGRDGAVVTCQWTQTQNYKGTPETATGRMTLVFKRVGTAWKAIHLHSSPDSPDPSRIPASEQQPAEDPAPTASPSPSPTPRRP